MNKRMREIELMIRIKMYFQDYTEKQNLKIISGFPYQIKQRMTKASLRHQRIAQVIITGSCF